jgi:SAM-dependent methyltransferase
MVDCSTEHGDGPEPAHVSATRRAYDRSAELYVGSVGTEVRDGIEATIDRSLLRAFAETVASQGAGPVLDAGCGPGRVTRFLADHGLDPIGIDLSTEMVTQARRAHPDLRFEPGELADLPLDPASMLGVVAWYSIIHTPPDRIDAIAAEFARVIRPGGPVLLGFQAGSGERVGRTIPVGDGVEIVNYRHDPDHIAAELGDVGLVVEARCLRQPIGDHERTPQAFLWAVNDRASRDSTL